MARLEVVKEIFDLRSSFSISRSVKNSIEVVRVEISDGKYKGSGECRPYERYGETPDRVIAQIESARASIERGLSRQELLEVFNAGAARNAIDCALWDLEAKKSGQSVWHLIGGKGDVHPVATVQTISLSSPEEMANSARGVGEYKTLKIKLGGGEEDLLRLRAIHEARPDVKIVIDANESWSFDQLRRFIDQAQELGVYMIEQPLPKDQDELLANYDAAPIIICGDESIHTVDDLDDKGELYGMVNIKLDKSGGLTHALEMVEKIKELNDKGKNIQTMIGCMVCTSLAIAPHILLAQNCDLADLDGPGWLKKDRAYGVKYQNGLVMPDKLWG
ncbi:MAG: dipeptide epimerase [Alphaproteobacteria bacterium]|nr:dipeptide epimerase [Alphaproteobacteria bacterium]